MAIFDGIKSRFNVKDEVEMIPQQFFPTVESKVGNKDLLDPQRLAIDMLKECDRWACKALLAYVHKQHLFDMSHLNIDKIYEHQQKIRIVIEKLEQSIEGK
jgi:hypothetical protein